jgi:hypothetical protein
MGMILKKLLLFPIGLLTLLRDFIYIFPLLLVLAGCGFTPIYEKVADKETISLLSLKVTGANQDAYAVYRLRSELEPQLASLSSLYEQSYRVQVILQEEFGDIGYASDGTAIRAQGRMVASVSVFDTTLTPIYENRLDSVSSYTINHGDEFSNLNAKDAVRERLITDLAQQIVQTLAESLKT